MSKLKAKRILLLWFVIVNHEDMSNSGKPSPKVQVACQGEKEIECIERARFPIIIHRFKILNIYSDKQVAFGIFVQ